MAMRIGCDHLVYAQMVTEDTSISAPVYGEVTGAPGVMSIKINPNASLATAFYDDGPGESASTLGNIEVEIQKNTLTTQNKADLLGHSIDTNGGVAYADDDVSPFVAIGFRTLKSNGKYRYVWLYKGRFADPEDNNETKADSINFQSDTINGQFVKLQYMYAIGSTLKRLWKYEIDADNPDAKQSVMDAWFDAVQVPAAAAATPASALTVSWEAGSAAGTTSATITGSAGEGNKFAYKVSLASIATPNVGSTVAGSTEYTSGEDITADTDEYVAIYELTSSNTVVKFVVHQLVALEVNAG